MKNFSKLIIAAVIGSAFTLGVSELISSEGNQQMSTVANQLPVKKVSYAAGVAADPSFDFTDAAKKAMPAVVHIRSTQTVNRDNRLDQIPEQWREFFGPFLQAPQNGPQQPRIGSGSGVIINSDGYIITNNHVIANADELNVTLSDNRSYTARVIGSDPQTDLALVKIDESNLPFLSMVNSDNVRIGEWVLAVGNPFNLTSTVTAGIISAKGRSINILTDTLAIESFLQTDAAVNPGNSGGALVDMNGNLVGINTAIASPTGSYSGYSFAVPSNIVSKVVEDIMTYGSVQRGLLGIQIGNLNSEFAESRDLTVSRGAYVVGISPHSAAGAAGIKEGDVIVEINDKLIRTSADLIGLIGRKRPGDVVNVKVNRYGEEIDYKVTLRNSEGTVEILEIEEKDYLSVLGAELEEVDKAVLDKLGIDNGVRVRKLVAGKIRKATNMREGFIITKIDGRGVSSIEEVVKIINSKEGGILIEGRYEGDPEIYYYGLGL